MFEILETDLKFGIMMPRLLSSIDTLILHHADAQHCTIKDVHGWHKNKGWAGIGYGYFISKTGKIYKGRPDRYVGANCTGHNAKSIGICLEGDFDVEKPTDIQIEALRWLVARIKGAYGGIKYIYNHKDLMATRCPVVNLKKYVL